MEAGYSYERACKQFWLVDKDGLLGSSRKGTKKNISLPLSLSHPHLKGIASAQLPFARTDAADGSKLLEVIQKVKPTILLGLSGVGGQFTEACIREMTKHCEVLFFFNL